MVQQTPYDVLGLAVIFATLLSPLLALVATIIYQKQDRRYQLRLSVFVDLMRSRRKNLSQEYVNSLNLVPVVFHDKPKIVSAFKGLMNVYESNDWRIHPESPNWNEVRQRLDQTLQNKTAVLLSTMAEVVRVKVDQLTILQGAYLPEQWYHEETLESEIKQSLRAILKNERPLPVFAHVASVVPIDQDSSAAAVQMPVPPQT